MDQINLEYLGISSPTAVYRNLPVPALVEEALERKEGILAENGALVVKTGKYTGRSPEDRFVVDEASVHDKISWGNINKPFAPEAFNKIYRKMTAYLQNKELYVFDGFAGADPAYRIGIRVINEMPSQNLFIHQLLIKPKEGELDGFRPGFTIIDAPGFKCIPAIDGTRSEAAILLSFEKKIVLIAGSQYAGEIKKSIFTIMNYLLPQEGVFPMHCSANIGKDGDVALFFGLSGTGKTTLSADPDRKLIGDDEHGWSTDGVFNFEGGCYAKCINLSRENEPQIWDAIRFGTLVENVVINENTRIMDYNDDSLTENTRAGYPIEYIPNAQIPGVGGHPKTIIFLTADAFGVMPPVAKLDKNQAMYHFVSGYTSKLAGTERGITVPQAVFSTCYGAPFLPLDPAVYANLLGKYMTKYGAKVYLINTGWTGGEYGVGKRMSIKYTRAMVTAALTGALESVEYHRDAIFNVDVPKTCPGVPSEVLDPRSTWTDKDAYEKSAASLAKKFVENFKKYTGMSQDIINGGPKG